MLKNSVDDKDAKDFYKEITALQEDPAEDKVTKLKDFTSSNKDILTYIYKKEDGLARLAGVMNSIGDGCGANIANNLNNMAISFLLDDNQIGGKNKNIALKLIYESLIAGGILQQAIGDGDHLGSNSNASIIKDYNKENPNNILNNRLITPDLLIEAIAKISNSEKHSDIVPQKIKDLALESNYLLDNFNKIIAINAIKLIIQNNANQNKITNNNSVIYRRIYQDDSNLSQYDESLDNSFIKINKTGAEKAPNNRIEKPSLIQQLLSYFSCCQD